MTPEDSQDKSAPQGKTNASQGAPAGDTLAAADAHSASAAAGVNDARAGAESAGAGSSPPAPARAAGVKPAAPAGTAQPAATGDPVAKAAMAPAAAKPAPAAGASATVKAAAPQPPTPPPPPKPQPINEFDPLGWDVPIICKDCDKPFVVPYRNFHAGVVFHCPSCQGSWVPSTTIAKEMRQVFEDFWGPRKRAREAFERGELKLDRAKFERRQAEELNAFKERLERLAAELKPAGKLVRPKGLAAMFT